MPILYHYCQVQKKSKKQHISYLLIDLNAATIDNDPRKDLTRRYENLLKGLVADNVELIKSDSLCLQVALDTYRLENDIEKILGQSKLIESYLKDLFGC